MFLQGNKGQTFVHKFGIATWGVFLIGARAESTSLADEFIENLI